MVLQDGEKDPDSGIRYNQTNIDKMEKMGDDDRKMLWNIMKKKLKEKIQSNEQVAINKYSESFCYACASKDQVLSTLIWSCPKCREKKGIEFIMAVQYKKPMEELCDICGLWRFNCWQINVSMCQKDMRRVHQIHRDYRKKGKRMGSPYMKHERKRLGKDFMLYHIPARNINQELMRR